MAKIQVIDDSETLRTQLRQTLEKDGHEVVEAMDGMHALEVLQSTRDVKLIICDLNMPRMDGMTLCEKLHQDPDLSKIPIFILTTEVSPDLKARAKNLGVRAWIIKPFAPDKVLTAVTYILGKA